MTKWGKTKADTLYIINVADFMGFLGFLDIMGRWDKWADRRCGKAMLSEGVLTGGPFVVGIKIEIEAAIVFIGSAEQPPLVYRDYIALDGHA